MHSTFVLLELLMWGCIPVLIMLLCTGSTLYNLHDDMGGMVKPCWELLMCLKLFLRPQQLALCASRKALMPSQPTCSYETVAELLKQ